MKTQLVSVTAADLCEVWGVIEPVARLELGFPEEALFEFRAPFQAQTHSAGVRALCETTLLARQNGIPVGVVVGGRAEGGVATIIWLIVIPEKRRQGVGRKLFEEACDLYRDKECHKIKLTVPTRRAVTFYEGLGMKNEGFYPRHWWRMDFWGMGMPLVQRGEEK